MHGEFLHQKSADPVEDFDIEPFFDRDPRGLPRYGSGGSPVTGAYRFYEHLGGTDAQGQRGERNA